MKRPLALYLLYIIDLLWLISVAWMIGPVFTMRVTENPGLPYFMWQQAMKLSWLLLAIPLATSLVCCALGIRGIVAWVAHNAVVVLSIPCALPLIISEAWPLGMAILSLSLVETCLGDEGRTRQYFVASEKLAPNKG